MSSIQDVYHNDSLRLARKGYGLFFALLTIYLYFFQFPSFCKRYLWQYVLLIQNINLMYFITSYSIHEFIFIVGNIIWYFIYINKFAFLEKYRISPQKAWPWEENPLKWRETFIKTMKSLLMIHFILIPIATGIEAYLGVAFKVSLEEWPHVSEIVTQIAFFMICEDFTFYWGHRALHSKTIYPRIHKIHHEYYNPIALCSEYAHPVEFLLVNMLPNAVGSKILGAKVHLATYILWLIIRVCETLDGHSGYEFSWSPFRLLPLSGSAQYHNYHHTNNDGNYGSFFMLWDTIMGTNRNYFKFLNEQEKEEDKKKK